MGWRSALPELVYLPPEVLRKPGMLLVLVAIILFAASGAPTRIKQVLRHPQLTGLLLWCAAHLMMNGDSRSVPLFGGLAIWAVLAMIGINRRDGEWVKPEAPPWSREIVLLLIGGAVYVGLVFAHPWLSGMPITG